MPSEQQKESERAGSNNKWKIVWEKVKQKVKAIVGIAVATCTLLAMNIFDIFDRVKIATGANQLILFGVVDIIFFLFILLIISKFFKPSLKFVIISVLCVHIITVVELSCFIVPDNNRQINKKLKCMKDIGTGNVPYNSKKFIESIRNNDIDLTKLFVCAGIDVNAIEEASGNTALMIASLNGYEDLVTLLLNSDDANVNDKNAKDGETALIKACHNNYTETIRRLLNGGADVNISNSLKKTPLIIAAENDYKDLVQQLLREKGLKINAQDNEGKTALIYSVINGYNEIGKDLLGAEADPDIKDREDQTALSYAENLRNLEMQQELEKCVKKRKYPSVNY